MKRILPCVFGAACGWNAQFCAFCTVLRKRNFCLISESALPVCRRLKFLAEFFFGRACIRVLFCCARFRRACVRPAVRGGRRLKFVCPSDVRKMIGAAAHGRRNPALRLNRGRPKFFLEAGCPGIVRGLSGEIASRFAGLPVIPPSGKEAFAAEAKRPQPPREETKKRAEIFGARDFGFLRKSN